jgi:hypothetical protein
MSYPLAGAYLYAQERPTSLYRLPAHYRHGCFYFASLYPLLAAITGQTITSRNRKPARLKKRR